MNGSVVSFPPELLPYRGVVEGYVEDRIREFAQYLAYKLNPTFRPEQVARLTQETLAALQVTKQAAPIAPPQHLAPPPPTLRLVLKHDCESSGCGDTDCILCQYNPNRLCVRNLKPKYLIDDNLKAKCGASVRVELNDDNGQALHSDIYLEAVMLSSDKYKEICMTGPVTHISQLRPCVVPQLQKALLRREGGKDEEMRMILQLERGRVNLSELQVTTSSEALLSGKAPGFLLLVFAVDARGMEIPSIQFVVSEKFVVTTKRVKQAIKSDIPTVDQHVSKLVHVGRATVDKLQGLRHSAIEEHIDIDLPDDLAVVDKVGQFQRLVEMADASSDFKQKILKLLKLSPEKWEELAAHAMNAVVPDSRPRVWCSSDAPFGLLFQAKHGAASLEHPVALLHLNTDGSSQDYVVPVHQLDPSSRDMVTQLRRQARLSWVLPRHPGWAIYWKDSEQIAALLQAAPQEAGTPETQGTQSDDPLPTQPVVRRTYAPPSSPAVSSTAASQMGNPSPAPVPSSSASAMNLQPPPQQPAAQQQAHFQQMLAMQRATSGSGHAAAGGNKSPFATGFLGTEQQQQQLLLAPKQPPSPWAAPAPELSDHSRRGAADIRTNLQLHEPPEQVLPPPRKSTPFTSMALQRDVFSALGAAPMAPPRPAGGPLPPPPQQQLPLHVPQRPPAPPQSFGADLLPMQEAVALQIASARAAGASGPGRPAQTTPSIEMITSDDLREMGSGLQLAQEQSLLRSSTDNWLLQMLHSNAALPQAFSAFNAQQLAALATAQPSSMPDLAELGLKFSASMDLTQDDANVQQQQQQQQNQHDN